jgi:hypothetical protein
VPCCRLPSYSGKCNFKSDQSIHGNGTTPENCSLLVYGLEYANSGSGLLAARENFAQIIQQKPLKTSHSGHGGVVRNPGDKPSLSPGPMIHHDNDLT